LSIFTLMARRSNLDSISGVSPLTGDENSEGGAEMVGTVVVVVVGIVVVVVEVVVLEDVVLVVVDVSTVSPPQENRTMTSAMMEYRLIDT
jgi:hypothetical protein